jgi:GNAT superfamily N-acetyltransferase
MAAVSQTLIDFGRNHRQLPSPGVEVIVTPRYQITLMPDFPLPGPNSVSWIRCRAEEIDDVIREARATITPRNLPVSWILDPGTEPSDFASRLAAHGVRADPHGEEATVMVLPVETPLDRPVIPGLVIRDALEDLALFKAADDVAAEAFAGIPFGENVEPAGTMARRLANDRASGNRRRLLATIDGVPAGSGSITVFAPQGAMINGGAVRPRFRGLGVYRALLAERLEIARREGAAGLAVWGGSMSAPILSRSGFQSVSWRRFYVDTSTAASS